MFLRFAGLAKRSFRVVSFSRTYSSQVATPVWEEARQLLELDADRAHEQLVDALDEALKEMKANAGEEWSWKIPLLLLELGKSFLKQNASSEATSSFEHAVQHFEDVLLVAGKEKKTLPVDETLLHQRYVESMLHLGKLRYLMGTDGAEHMWKKSISHAVRHLGKDAYEILVASNGLAELLLEQLRLPEAERFAAASVELSKQLLGDGDKQYTRRVHERLIEATVMQGLGRVQQQDLDSGLRLYQEALAQLEDLEKREGGAMDNYLRSGFFNLYRNIEHVYKSKGQDDMANATKDLSNSKLGRFVDVQLEEGEGGEGTLEKKLEEHNNVAENATKSKD